jgi:putative nucleotidyltransferase with HDIG domain
MAITNEGGPELERLNRMYRTITTCNHHLIHAEDEEALARKLCETMIELGEYRMAWVGYAVHDETCSIKPVAFAGKEDGYIKNLNLTWAENERGVGPSARSIREGKSQVVHDIASDPYYSFWRAEAMKRGYASSIALPLKNREGTFGFLGIYSAFPDAFDEVEVGLLEEAADDLAFGITILRDRAERDMLLGERLRNLEEHDHNLETTVQAIATMVELRDPFTAGHQRRVAKLAVAIARAMGLSEKRIEGLRLAAILHDIGKIRVPAEILSNPGRLTSAEFEIVKTHPSFGFDILKDIQFAWPVAQTVFQHHERLDGSGYPGGLKGDEILLEARILAVADVVEAIASHRPYRPALTIESALEEIEGLQDKSFDPDVVKTCLQLFRELKYEL